MAEKKYVDFSALSYYDGKIKALIQTKDEAVLAAAKAWAEGLAGNYDAAGSAATAEQNAKNFTTEQINAVNQTVAGVKTTAEQGVADAAKAQAAADKAQGEVDALETYVGTIPAGATATNVVAYINEKTAGIATDAALTNLTNRVTAAEGAIDAIEADYLVEADKTELAGLISTETGRAQGIEAGLQSAIDAIEADYLKAADKTELQNNIDTLTGVVETLADGVDADKVDGVKDLIAYVETHGAEVTGMKADIKQNADDIDALEGRMTTAEGKITALETASATHATTAALESAVSALEGVDAGQETRIAALEAKFTGDDSVADQIAAAVAAEAVLREQGDAAAEASAAAALKAAQTAQGEVDALEGVVSALDGVVATKAAQADLTALDGRVTVAEGKITTLEGASHTHDNKSVLDGITATLVADWNDAVSKEHEHTNKSVIDGITAALVSSWNAAESNAKAYTDEKIAEFVPVTTGEIDGLFA